MLGKVITGLLNLFPSVIVPLAVMDVGFHQSDVKTSLSARCFTLELGGVDLVFKASATGILDHKALLVSRVHLIKEERDQLDFHITQFALLDDPALGSEYIHSTSYGVVILVIAI
jgi:hypothetical protein